MTGKATELDFFAPFFRFGAVFGRRRRVFRAAGLLLLFFVAGCLAPVPSYQKTDLETSAVDLRHIAIAPIAERRGQILRTMLEERLASAGRKLRKTHDISVSLEVDNDERDFGRARIVGEMRATAKFVLREKRSKEQKDLLRGSIFMRSNYTVRSDFLARRDAEEEALRHVLALVADDMLVRMRLYFFTQSKKERELKKDSPSP